MKRRNLEGQEDLEDQEGLGTVRWSLLKSLEFQELQCPLCIPVVLEVQEALEDLVVQGLKPLQSKRLSQSFLGHLEHLADPECLVHLGILLVQELLLIL